MAKKAISATYARKFESIFQCPVCGSSMQVVDLKSLVCSHNHTFDFAKQGYVNLLTRPTKTKYKKDLFQARRKLYAEGGFFEPLIRSIAKFIIKQASKKETVYVLDSGCGEGFHLSNVCEIVTAVGKTVTGVGVDLSKEGVAIASQHDSNKIWCVADLARAPFKDKQFDVILNILSPSNYTQFNRLLKPNGFVLKVVPQNGYLKELRDAFFDEAEKQTYSNKGTVDRFQEAFPEFDRSRICYTMSLDQPSIHSLVRMTPLAWRAPEERVRSFLEREAADITVDLEILIGYKYSD